MDKEKINIDDNINLDNLKKNHLENDYYMYLLNKYGLSNDINLKKDKIDLNDFKKWLKEYIELTKKYAKFTEQCGINLNSPSLGELGKGKYDAIILPKAHEISRYSKTMNRPKLIIGDINKGLLIYENKKIFSLDELGINTIITQNPNKNSEINNLIIFYNKFNKNIAFGIYGYFSDKDIEYKTVLIKDILERTNHNKFEYETDKDNYYMLVRTIKKLSR